MTDCNPLLVSSYEPIVGGLIAVALHEDGWNLTIRHRHSFGQYSDCWTSSFGSLTMGEMLDVLGAVLDMWGLPAPLTQQLEP